MYIQSNLSMIVLLIKKYILHFLGIISKNGRLSFTISYINNRHRIPNFKKPKDISEIWIKRIIDGNINSLYYLADKHLVRQYVTEKGLAEILVRELGVYKSGDEINFDNLPERFALKANFGAGKNIICTDKNNLDIEYVKKQITSWFNIKKYSYSERHYNLIDKKVICEEFIDDGNGGFPIDYKFMCINGHVQCILACSGRETNQTYYLPYSTNWKPLYNYYKKVKEDNTLLKAPDNLSEMINVAETLSKGIELVRIDLYSNSKRIWFGEITLTPSGGIFHRWSNHAMEEMGKFYRETL